MMKTTTVEFMAQKAVLKKQKNKKTEAISTTVFFRFGGTKHSKIGPSTGEKSPNNVQEANTSRQNGLRTP